MCLWFPLVTSTNTNMVRYIGQGSARTSDGLAKVHISVHSVEPSPTALRRLADIQALHS